MSHQGYSPELCTEFYWSIGFQLLSLGVQVTEGQPTPGQFRDSVQDFNHLKDFISSKACFHLSTHCPGPALPVPVSYIWAK